MIRPRFVPLALAAWTLFVWTTRIRNVVTDDALDTSARTARVALSMSFTVLAAFVVWAVFRARERVGPTVRTLAGWTLVVWIARSVGIAGGGHDAAFVVVHLLLAVVSVALAWFATREVRRFSVGAGRH